MTAAIDVSQLQVRYPTGDADALAGVSFAIEPGEVVGLLGPNGSGKSTLFRVLSTQLRPTAGTAKVCGLDTATDSARVRQSIGVLFQSPALDKELTARENLWCHGRLLGLDRGEVKSQSAALLERVGLADVAGKRAGTFSGGMRRRLEIAKSLLGSPAVLLMDEPTVGLDPAARRQVWELIADARQRGADAGRPMTVLVATHLLDEAERLERLMLMHAGEVVADASPRELMRRAIGSDGERRIVTLVASKDAELSALADAVDGEVQAGVVRLATSQPAEVIRRAIDGELGVVVRHASVGEPTLEDAYLNLTGSRLTDSA